MSPERKQKIMNNVLVILTVVIVLGILLYPFLTWGEEYRYFPRCIDNVREIATAAAMYAQDNENRYPGLPWTALLENYVGSQKTFSCPQDESMDDERTPVSYGYNAALVLPDGSGMAVIRVKDPAKLGLIADVRPARAWVDGGGLVGDAAGWPGRRVFPYSHREDDVSPRHNPHVSANPNQPLRTGYHLAYCDGHAEIVPTRAAVDQAFIRAQTLGYLK